ncbi:ROK family transcriptional regulator [Citrobacter farmeri]|uniref:ROK family transcriptional regulator n=1 Tax=Citrobacter farmeri TaxID=67824 RepID=UPI00189BCC14|nr:ROK family transcriptional regulator [Citrobacter farmeri]MBJ9133954.1 ROK family transcriptional regulator [Citrobacter farmeri]MDB2171486.1 ROK family transcriptional regulator [Citrobacter farmeri]HED3139051.1 ROK family transcriptional regulator [Citrobacter farmeri]
MQHSGFNNARVRQANKQIFLSHLWREKQLSKSQLAQLTGLSIPAVSNILEELLDEGRICHSRETLSQRGLSSGSFHLPEQGAWTLCMNVTPTSLTSQLADARLVAVGDWQHEVINAATPEALLTAIANHWRRWRQHYPDITINLALGVHGQVDPITGASKTMPQAPWKTPVEIKYLLEERLGIQVRLDNDCVMLALAEKWQNPAANEDFCVINVDYGIGSSFVIHDSIWRGSLYGSGQIGHTIVNPDGIACDCGRYGCLETVASLSALKKQARVWMKAQPVPGKDPETLTTDMLIDAWRKGDVRIQAWVEHAASAIGLSLYNFLNILNINQIWLYGRSCAFGEPWLNTLRQQTGFNPFDHGDNPRAKATQIGFGTLTRAQQLMGIGYLYVESQLNEI